MKKRGILSRLLGPKEFEASKPWDASIAQPVAQPQAFTPPYERPHVLARYFDLNWRHALASGFFAGLCLGLLWPVIGGNELKWYEPLGAGLISFAGTSLIVWGILLFIDRKGLMKSETANLEALLGVDLNRDGHIGEPKTTIVDFTDHDKNQQQIAELPVSYTIMQEIAKAMLQSGKRYNFSRRDMLAATSISDDQFEQLQRKFLVSGWAAYKVKDKPNTGVILLASGRAILRRYL